MEIVITRWALDAYLDLKNENAFSGSEFNEKIKPDVLLTKEYPEHPKFKNNKFWSLVSLFRILEMKNWNLYTK